jgi:hypothetical protein
MACQHHLQCLWFIMHLYLICAKFALIFRYFYFYAVQILGSDVLKDCASQSSFNSNFSSCCLQNMKFFPFRNKTKLNLKNCKSISLKTQFCYQLLWPLVIWGFFLTQNIIFRVQRSLHTECVFRSHLSCILHYILRKLLQNMKMPLCIMCPVFCCMKPNLKSNWSTRLEFFNIDWNIKLEN